MKESDFNLIFKFMQVTVNKSSEAFASISAIEQILIEKGIVTLPELKNKIKETKKLPERLINISTLEQMIKEFNRKEE